MFLDKKQQGFYDKPLTLYIPMVVSTFFNMVKD